jgi:hypothetical protein
MIVAEPKDHAASGGSATCHDCSSIIGAATCRGVLRCCVCSGHICSRRCPCLIDCRCSSSCRTHCRTPPASRQYVCSVVGRNAKVARRGVVTDNVACIGHRQEAGRTLQGGASASAASAKLTAATSYNFVCVNLPGHMLFNRTLRLPAVP